MANNKKLFAQLIQAAAKTGQAAVGGLNQTKGAKRRRKKGKAGCTPCEAMARRDRAAQWVNGG